MIIARILSVLACVFSPHYEEETVLFASTGDLKNGHNLGAVDDTLRNTILQLDTFECKNLSQRNQTNGIPVGCGYGYDWVAEGRVLFPDNALSLRAKRESFTLTMQKMPTDEFNEKYFGGAKE